LFKCHHDKIIAHKKVVVKYFLIAKKRTAKKRKPYSPCSSYGPNV
jgi:hypothetical protein